MIDYTLAPLVLTGALLINKAQQEKDTVHLTAPDLHAKVLK